MSHHIPTYAVVLPPEEAPAQLTSCWDTTEVIKGRYNGPDIWESTSRNNWHQWLLQSCIEAHSKFAPLDYLTDEVAYLSPTDISSRIAILEAFLYDVERAPTIVSQNGFWRGTCPYPESDVLDGLAAAEVLAAVDDEQFAQKSGFDSFFSYLRSHLAALQTAKNRGHGLLYVQFQA